MLNGVGKVRIMVYIGGFDYDDVGFNLVVLFLSKEDRVWIVYNRGWGYNENGYLIMFFGFFI